jgi:hypothetical protein
MPGMEQPLRPVLVFSRDGDVDVFASVRAAAGYLEAIDVEDGEYAAIFTYDGCEVAATTGAGNEVHLTITDRHDPDRLEELVRRARPEAAGVVGLANEELRLAWEGRWPRRPRWLHRRVRGDAPPPQV